MSGKNIRAIIVNTIPPVLVLAFLAAFFIMSSGRFRQGFPEIWPEEGDVDLRGYDFNDEIYQSDYEEEMNLADSDKFRLALDYYPKPAKDGTVWHMDARPQDEERLDYYTASLDKDGNVLNAIARTRKNPNTTERQAQNPVPEASDVSAASGSFFMLSTV